MPSPEDLWAELMGSGGQGSVFLASWLAVQCQFVPGTTAGLLVVLEQSDKARYRVVASWPDPAQQLPDLGAVAEQAVTERRDVWSWGRQDPATNHPQSIGLLLAHPLRARGDNLLFAAVAIAVAAPRGPMSVDPKAITEQLEWGSGWLGGLASLERTEAASEAVNRAAAGLDLVAVAGEHRRSKPAAMALVNELAGRFSCDRVSLGLARGGRIRLTAISHSSWFQRKSQEVEAIENAMEEAADQNRTVVIPTVADREQRIAAAHDVLLKRGPTSAAASVVLAARGRILGALTFERQRSAAFAENELKLFEMIAALVAPITALQVDCDRWLSGAAIDRVVEAAKALFGRRRPVLKLAAIATLAALTFLGLAEMQHRVAAKSVIEGLVQRAAVAPFDGFIKTAAVRAGDTVRDGEVLATLDDRELVLERLKWRGEREKLLQKQRDALAKHDRAALSVLTPQIEQVESQLRLADEKRARTQIKAPFDGIVVSGDLTQLLGSPVEKGKVLFEVTPLDAYRVVIQVDERDIGYVKHGQPGSLALAGLPAEPLPLTVTKTTPVATSEEGRNYFRVEASLASAMVPLRPGMEGIAKIEIAPRSLVWVWTHSVIEWVQLTWWKWTP